MSRFVLITVVLLLAGCQSTARRCESVCTEFMTTCGWTAWADVDSCKAGCEDDLYRRSDADEVLDCYEAAVAQMPREQAEDVIDQALLEGIFSTQEAANTFNYIREVERFQEASTCDLFATVQCKVQAVQQPIDTPLLND